jgi:heptosyltransferase-3
MNPTFLLKPPRHVLLVCTRRIGDVLLTTPLARSLKHAWPEARIDMLVFEGTEGILEGDPDIDNVITVPSRTEFAGKLAQFRSLWRRYDLALSPLATDRARLYCWVAGRRRLGLINPQAKDRAKALLLNDWLRFDDLHTHTVTMGLRLAEQLGVSVCREVVPPAVEDGGARVTNLLEPLRGAPFAVIHPYPKFSYKMWHREGWLELARWLHQAGLRIVITGGPYTDEIAYCHAIAEQLGDFVHNLAGFLSLAETAEVIRRARLFVGPDTAITHIAAATGVPTVALFGPSNPVKWGPWPIGWDHDESPWPWRGSMHQGNVFLLQGQGDCVPCLLEGCDRHVRSNSECLMKMPAAAVISAVEKVWLER